jgi:hypothetical protein
MFAGSKVLQQLVQQGRVDPSAVAKLQSSSGNAKVRQRGFSYVSHTFHMFHLLVNILYINMCIYIYTPLLTPHSYPQRGVLGLCSLYETLYFYILLGGLRPPKSPIGSFAALGATILYYTIYIYILYYTIRYDTILYYTILYYTIPYHTIPYHTIPYHTIP